MNARHYQRGRFRSKGAPRGEGVLPSKSLVLMLRHVPLAVDGLHAPKHVEV
jgi:hypothetical protein